MATLNGSYAINLDFLYLSTSNTVGSVKESVSVPVPALSKYTFTDGTGANQAQKIWSFSGTLTATTITYDLTALTGAVGSVSFSKIKMVYIANTATVDGRNLIVGNAASNSWQGPLSSSATDSVGAGGILFKASPLATAWVVDGTHKNLKLDSGANTVPYTIILVGT